MMAIESALLKQIVEHGDFDTWNDLKQHYLPQGEYQKLWKVVDKHVHKYHELPSFEDLKSEIRSRELQEKIYAIESVDTDVPAYKLLEYLKDQFTQSEILEQLEVYIDEHITIADASENIDFMQKIVVDVQDRVETATDNESMESVELFDSEEDLAKYLPLGLNNDYDKDNNFSPKDLVIVGGGSGKGKSFTCCNIADAVYNRGRSVLYFTIEMDSRSILQRLASVATRVPLKRLHSRNLVDFEWDAVAEWWANRFESGDVPLETYKKERDFDKFTYELQRNSLKEGAQIDVFYDPALTLAKIIAVVRQKKVEHQDLGLVVVDYLNQVRRHNVPGRSGQYDWTEQIEISKGLKQLAQEVNVLCLSAFQTNPKGEARFARGIYDAVDAAYVLEHWGKEEPAIKFTCVKMRNGDPSGFTSVMDWDALKIGPNSALDPDERDALMDAMKENESIDDM